MKYLLCVFILISIFSCQSDTATVQEQVQVSDVYVQFSPEAFKNAIANNPDAQLIDVRTPREYEKGHITNAKLVNYKDRSFKAELDKLDKTQPVYVYCQSGGRSRSACELMEKEGFANIIELTGGYGNWK